jgi:hypothetical protein
MRGFSPLVRVLGYSQQGLPGTLAERMAHEQVMQQGMPQEHRFDFLQAPHRELDQASIVEEGVHPFHSVASS